MRVMRASLAFGKNIVTFWDTSVVTKIVLVTECTDENDSLIDEFTTDKDLNGDGEKKDDERDETEGSLTEELVLTLTEGKQKTRKYPKEK